MGFCHFVVLHFYIISFILQVVATVTTLFSNQRHITESVDFVRLHLSNFKGVSRRFEMIGKVRGCHIFDDYAHHPSEVRAVLQAARQGFQYKELLVVFQPHTYRCPLVWHGNGTHKFLEIMS